MAEEEGQERTEEPTAKRLEEAKKKGQIARSRELNTVAMLLVSAGLLMSQGARIGNGFLDLMHRQFFVERDKLFDSLSMVVFFKQAMIDGLLLVAPLLVALVLIALIAPIALGGWIFSPEAFTPKFDKLNPITGIPRLFSMNGLVELIKGLLKIALVGFVGYLLFRSMANDLLALNSEPVKQGILHAIELILRCFLILSASLILIAALDVPYQLWSHSQKLKMTLQEIKDEMKESDGNPEIKGRIRRTQQEIAHNRMMSDIPKADVVITNPTHYAIALKYDESSGSAPILIAKGVDLIAAQIRSVATASEIPLVASPPLARALYYSTEINEEIPHGLYVAVAQVLAYVFQLKNAYAQHLRPPPPPRDIEIPEEFRQD